MGTIYLDADACPVKEYVFRVAARYDIPLVVVANSPIRIPDQAGLTARLVVVPDSPDAADDWIVEHAVEGDLVLTADIPLAARVIWNTVDAIDFRGGVYNPNRIGDAVASRDLNAHLRQMGLITGGPSAFSQQDKTSSPRRWTRRSTGSGGGWIGPMPRSHMGWDDPGTKRRWPRLAAFARLSMRSRGVNSTLKHRIERRHARHLPGVHDGWEICE